MSIDDVGRFLLSNLFTTWILPAFTIVVSILVKVTSRPDGFQKFYRDDLAFGFDLTLAGMFALIGYSIPLAKQAADPLATPQTMVMVATRLVAVAGLLFLFGVGVFVVAVLVRARGWITPPPPTAGAAPAPRELNKVGILGPIVFGIAVFVLVSSWIGA